MASIVTLTFSPCIDKSTLVSSFNSRKKTPMYGTGTRTGGGGINVARAIKKLGGEATATFLPVVIPESFLIIYYSRKISPP